MHSYMKSGLVALIPFFLLSCATPKGMNKQEMRYNVLKMKNDTLKELYRKKPETRSMIRKAAGYAVFSNISSYLLFVSSGNGYGMVVDSSSGKKTYMKMAQIGVGFGMGVKDFRLIFMFKTREVMNYFVEKGWEFGGQADAAAKSGEKGGAAGGEIYIEGNIVIYQLTEAGVALQATVAGTKYWKDKDLN